MVNKSSSLFRRVLAGLCLLSWGVAGQAYVVAMPMGKLPGSEAVLRSGNGCMDLAVSMSGDTNYRDAEGRRQGLWIHDSEGEGLDYRGCFKDDMPEGWFVYARRDTLVAKAFYFRGGYASHNLFFYPDSQLMAEGYYLEKRKDSIWNFYGRDGRLVKREGYERGLKHGVMELYGDSGTVLVHQEWFRGFRNGSWFERSANGMQEYTYKLNLTHGRYSAFYPDSTLATAGQYEEGLKQGKWSFFFPSGRLYKEDFFQDNRVVRRILYLSFQGRLQPVCTDTLAMVMHSPRGGKAELLTDGGMRLVCDDDFSSVCGILDMEDFFYANKNTLVSFQVLDTDCLPGFLEQLPESSGDDLYDGQKDPMQQLGRTASVRPIELPLKIKPPFPVYVDANGMDVLKNVLSDKEVPPEDTDEPVNPVFWK